MLQCTKILAPNLDQNDFRLVDAPVPPVGGRRLDKLIPEFFLCGKYGIRIAVTCGLDYVWSAEEFAQTLKRCAANGRKDSVYSWSIGNSDTVYVANIYATTEDNSGTEVDAVMGAFHGSLRNICESIMEKATDMTSKAKDKIQTACTQLKNLEESPILCSMPQFAKSISQSFSSVDVMRGFPTVMILIFLPEFAFDAFLNQKSYYFKQIEYVLLFESENRRKREEAEARASRLSQELETVKSELADTKRQLLAEKSESKRKELVALLVEKERKIAELQESLTKARCEIERLESILAAEQSKTTELKTRLAAEVIKNKELETALSKEREIKQRTLLIPSQFPSCFSYSIDLRALTQNDNWYSNEAEKKETAMMNPEYSKYAGPLTSQEGSRITVISDKETNPAIQDRDLTPQTVIVNLEKSVQVFKSPDRRTNADALIDIDERRNGKEEERER